MKIEIEKLNITEAEKSFLRLFYSMVAGAFYRVTWQRKVKTLKAYADCSLVKTVVAYIKSGCNYDNLASVQDKRASGELPSVNAGLPWGTWLDFPRVIIHKGNLYLRLYPANEFGTMQVSYTLNGHAATKEMAKEIALASEFQERESLDCFTVKLGNLQNFERVVTPTSPNWECTVESFLCRD